MARRKSALSLIWICLMTTGLISFQWYFIGYTLSFSRGASTFIGDFRNIGLRNVLGRPARAASGKIPELLHSVYQSMFACVT